ncbi:MAG: glycine cleavage system protein GcvH [bacterium]|nr:glycine cleavage system protein GcvH [bacterium]MDE0238720.1 glycine cleavage system protein GcvH [bacterium]MDE0418737.1 glycine cleavage system protein GcvH [bacterium]
MGNRLYSKEHEWIVVDDDVGTVGISDYAQEQLGDVVFVELPESGREVARNDELCVVESVKAASEVYAPVSGEVVEVNDALGDDPAEVNADPYGSGWFVRIRLADAGELDELMDEDAYGEYLSELA